MAIWETRLLKAVKVITKWNDGSQSIEEFSVAEYADPLRQARKIAMNRMLDDEWAFVTITKVYAERGESITVLVQHQL